MKYIIISLKFKELAFWRADNAGYTVFPFVAGHYTEEQVKSNPAYYNNGEDTIAVPLTDAGMEAIGFSSKVDKKKLKDFIAAKAHKKTAATE